MSKWEKVSFEDLKRQFFATKPKDVDGLANTSALYYREWMLKKIFGRFKIDGVPDGWDLDYMLEALFLNGMLVITDTEAGIVPLKCGVTGLNIFEHPTEFIIANPVLGSKRGVIDVDGALVKIQYNYGNINNMLDRYASLLAMCDSSIAVNLMNSKVAFIGMAANKAQAETMKKMYDTISCGEPAVFVNGDVVNSEKFYFNHVKENYAADLIQLTKKEIVHEFLTEIGINNANQDKKERLVTDEVRANDEEVFFNVQHWLNNIQEGFDVANILYGLDLKISLNNFERGEIQNEPDELGELE